MFKIGFYEKTRQIVVIIIMCYLLEQFTDSYTKLNFILKFYRTKKVRVKSTAKSAGLFKPNRKREK